jgi:hypothetical protein
MNFKSIKKRNFSLNSALSPNRSLETINYPSFSILLGSVEILIELVGVYAAIL